MDLPIYLDYMATTPIDPRVKDEMLKFLTADGIFASPGALHSYGQKAKTAVENSRLQVAELVNAKPEEIVWTSGATEANNLAIKGAAGFYNRKGRHIITCQTEHKSVLEPIKHLISKGYEATFLKPQKNGLIDLNQLEDAIRPDTIMVSIMHVNNEIGVIQDIKKIGELVKPKGVVFHVDAAQSVGKTAIDLNIIPADLMSFSAHKAYGPKGVGALYVRQEPRIRLEPQIHGGGQEFGLRSGTLPTHQIVGMGKAFALAKEEATKNCEYISGLHNILLNGLLAIGDVSINGAKEQRVPHNLNVSFAKVDGKKLFSCLTEIAASQAATCVATGFVPSYVLQAIGVNHELSLSSIRLSLGNFTTENEINYIIQYLTSLITKLRKDAAC